MKKVGSAFIKLQLVSICARTCKPWNQHKNPVFDQIFVLDNACGIGGDSDVLMINAGQYQSRSYALTLRAPCCTLHLTQVETAQLSIYKTKSHGMPVHVRLDQKNKFIGWQAKTLNHRPTDLQSRGFKQEACTNSEIQTCSSNSL